MNAKTELNDDSAIIERNRSMKLHFHVAAFAESGHNVTDHGLNAAVAPRPHPLPALKAQGSPLMIKGTREPVLM
jgi:hypothetical protein